MSNETQQHPYYPPMQPQPEKNGFAVPAFVLAFFIWPVGLILGILGLVKSGKTGTGRGLSLAAVILSALSGLGIIILIAALAGSGGGSSSNGVSGEGGDTQPSSAPNQFAGQTSDDVVAQPGQTVNLGDVSVTATALSTSTDPLGTTQLCSTVSYVNNGDSQESFNIFDFSLQDPNGAARTVGITGDNSLSSGELAPGGTTSGNVCFDGGTAPGSYVLLYAPTFSFDNARGAWVNAI